MINVVELFAGVGGFRLGLEGWKGKSASSQYTENIDTPYRIIWSNQWEPSTKTQHASIAYENRFGKKGHINEDINSVNVSDIPDCDLLVGGFPCQDYSVATTLKNSKGLLGKKGVLWWSIYNILSNKENKPKYIFLENVDRLLISPSKQRGRDFAIMLKSLNDLGYAVEWRVVNASEYGMPQRRKRIFILAYLKGSKVYNEMFKSTASNWLLSKGVISEAFSVAVAGDLKTFELKDDIAVLSESFNIDGAKGVFENTGMIIDDKVFTVKTTPIFNGEYTTLGDILEKDRVDSEFYIDTETFDKWKYLKGAKKEVRRNASGFEYNYSEGGMSFPDALDKASRTIITGEGGVSASRFKHVVETNYGYRRLTPIELERLNMFPDNHTKCEGISNTKRAFFMGNALVVGVIEKIGQSLSKRI